MKRFISMCLALILALGALLSFSGCSPKKDDLTVGEWLSMVNDEFGMYSYRTDEPYIDGMSPDDPNYEAAQIAGDWGLIPKGSALDLDAPLTNEIAAATLAKTIGAEDFGDMSDAEIAQYSADNGYLAFDYKNGNGKVSAEDAMASISVAKDAWANQTFPDSSVFKYADGVREIDPNAAIRSGNRLLLDGGAGGLQAGDTIVIPSNVPGEAPEAYIINSITDDGVAEVTPVDANTLIQEVHVSGTAGFSMDSMQVIDGLGNIISEPSSIAGLAAIDRPIIGFLGFSGQRAAVGEVKKKSSGLDFSVGDMKITGTVSDDGVSFSAAGNLSIGSGKVKVQKSYDINNIGVSVNNDILEWNGLWPKIKHIYCCLHYNTVDKSTLTFDWEKKASFYYDNRRSFTLSNVLSSELKQKAGADGSRTIKICTIHLFGVPGARLTLDIRIKVTVNGKVELVVTTSNNYGVEIKDGNIRTISESNKNTTLDMKAKLEAMAYLGLNVKIATKNVVGFGVDAGFGVKGEVTAHLVSEKNEELEVGKASGNTEMVEEVLAAAKDGSGKRVESCVDVQTYGLLSIGLDQECKAKEWLGNKVKTSWVIFDESSGRIDALCFHMEDGQRVPYCTRKYGGEAETTTTSGDSGGGDSGGGNGGSDDNGGGGGNGGSDSDSGAGNDDNSAYSPFDGSHQLPLDSYVMFLSVNESQAMGVTIPEGYSQSSLRWTSSNTSVASVSGGTVRGVKAGTAEITVQTSDGKYGNSFMVTVSSWEDVNYAPGWLPADAALTAI